MMVEARLYEKVSDNRVRCYLCAHRCLILEGKKGICNARENRGGTLYSLVYGHVISQRIDPIEKKPLFHFYPGSTAYSIATPGCNFHCWWCQNWELSQQPLARQSETGLTMTPQQVVANALRVDSQSIAHTYTEPTAFFEYAYDTARLAHAIGIRNVFVTNGYMTAETLELLRPYLDAANVDLKAFRDETYRRYIGARLQPVLDSLKRMKTLGIWLEVTTLLIPGINDDHVELRDAAQFISHELGSDVPWHISRFYPAYKMRGVSSTPADTLRRAWELGLKEGLSYVYVGNLAGNDYQNTVCPACDRILIRRSGFVVLTNLIRDGRCPDCGAYIAGVGMHNWRDVV